MKTSVKGTNKVKAAPAAKEPAKVPASTQKKRKQPYKEQSIEENDEPAPKKVAKVSPEPEPSAPTTFSSLNIDEVLQKTLSKLKITTLNKLQTTLLPLLLNGKDALTVAPFGNGKTFSAILSAINILQSVSFKQRNFSGLFIVCPTREQALLTYALVKQLTQLIPNISHAIVLSNTNHVIEFTRLQKGVSIVVATPERLLQHLTHKDAIFHKNVLSLIIDDCEEMVKHNHTQTILDIASLLDPLRQTICLSSQNTPIIQKLCRSICTKPALVGIDLDNTAVPKREAEEEQIIIPHYIHQSAVAVPTARRFDLLYTFVKKNITKKTIVFVQSADEVSYLAALFNRFFIFAFQLHDKQNQRKSTQAYFEFLNAKESAVLFCTELVARQFRFPPVDYILHFDVPVSISNYAQRLSCISSVAINTDGSPNASASYEEPRLMKSVIFIMDNEHSFLTNLHSFINKHNDTVKQQQPLVLAEYNLPTLIPMGKQLLDINKQNFFLHTSSRTAYFAFTRHYVQYKPKVEPKPDVNGNFIFKDGTYDFDGLKFAALAKSFGFDAPPAIKEQDNKY